MNMFQKYLEEAKNKPLDNIEEKILNSKINDALKKVSQAIKLLDIKDYEKCKENLIETINDIVEFQGDLKSSLDN